MVFPIQSRHGGISQDQGKQGLTEGLLLYAAQGSSQFDAEIAKKGHLWMETI